MFTVYQYKVSVFTGEESKAGTDSNVHLQIFGECGDTGFRKLLTSKTHENKFEQGNVSTYYSIKPFPNYRKLRKYLGLIVIKII